MILCVCVQCVTEKVRCTVRMDNVFDCRTSVMEIVTVVTPATNDTVTSHPLLRLLLLVSDCFTGVVY